ncbi:MAG TPA: ATP-binding protein [Parafilimonas sp.]|nr:ATP-binding protein [Parafilimonas sp.]
MVSFISVAQQSSGSKQQVKNPSAAVKKIEALEKQALDLSASNIDSAMAVAKLAVKLAGDYKNDTCLGFAYMPLGWCYYYAGNRDSAEYYLLKAANISRKVNMPLLEGRCLINLSYVYQDGAEYIKLLDCLKRARPLVEKDKDETILAGLDLTMGSTYGDMQLYEQGKKYIFSAIATYKKLNKTEFLSSGYSALGYLLLQQGDFDSALYYYHEGYAVSVQLQDTESMAITADNLGEAFQKKANSLNCSYCIDSAYYYYKIGLHWFTEMNSPGYIEYAKMNIGSVLITKKEHTTAEEYLTESFHYFDSINDVKYAYTSAQLLSTLYENLHDYKQAYHYNVVSLELKDSLDAKNRADSISKMFALYETEKRGRTIQLLNAKAKLDNDKIERQHMILWFAIISVMLAVVLLIVVVNRNRIRQQLKEVNVRNQLASDLHDEVGSSLGSILLLSKMAATQKSDDNILLEKISGNTKDVIDKMSDIVWMMNPKYDEGENLREKLEQYIARIKDVASFKINLEIDAGVDAIKFTMEIRKAVFLIVKEAANNAMKYAQATNFFIQLGIKEKNLLLFLSDDGTGFNINEAENGNGLGSMALRTKNVKGSFEIKSVTGKGTQIKVTIPVPHFREKIKYGEY